MQLWYWYKNDKDQWNRMETQNSVHMHMIKRVPKNTQWGKDSLLINSVRKTEHTHTKEWN